MRDALLTRRAREMRTNMTEPEARLWLELRAKRFGEVKFRRQKMIQDDAHRCIADSAANDPKLVVELDGDTHAGREAHDAVRTRFLESRGYRVVRFTNWRVMTNLDGVLWRIGEVIGELRETAPLPASPLKGRGEDEGLSPLQGRDSEPCERSELGEVERGRAARGRT